MCFIGTMRQKHIVEKSIACLVVLLFFFPLVNRAEAHVTLLYPAGGESFQPGSLITIEWRLDVPHNQQNWDLYYSADDGMTWRAVQLDLPVSQLTYQWAVPQDETGEGRIRIVQDNVGMNYESSSGAFRIEAVATVIDRPDAVPEIPALLTGYPNPFTTETVLAFTVAQAGPVTLEVFDEQGKRMATLVDRTLAKGAYEVTWNAEGRASGVYFCRIREGAYIEIKEVLLVK